MPRDRTLWFNGISAWSGLSFFFFIACNKHSANVNNSYNIWLELWAKQICARFVNFQFAGPLFSANWAHIYTTQKIYMYILPQAQYSGCTCIYLRKLARIRNGWHQYWRISVCLHIYSREKSILNANVRIEQDMKFYGPAKKKRQTFIIGWSRWRGRG